MNMDKLLNKKVVKQTVGDLKKALKDVPDDREIVLTFLLYDEGMKNVYLAETYTEMGYDPVRKEKVFNDKIVELIGFIDDRCTYVERKDEVSE